MEVFLTLGKRQTLLKSVQLMHGSILLVTIPSRATPGTSQLLHSRAWMWGIALSGFVHGGSGKGKSKMPSRLISHLYLTLSYAGYLDTRLLLVLLVKYVMEPEGTKGEIGGKSCVVWPKMVLLSMRDCISCFLSTLFQFFFSNSGISNRSVKLEAALSCFNNMAVY